MHLETNLLITPGNHTYCIPIIPRAWVLSTLVTSSGSP